MMKEQKKMRRATLLCAATVVKKTSGIMAGMPCVWWNYQPKMPKSVKKMRKF